jgi:hypothetical protein
MLRLATTVHSYSSLCRLVKGLTCRHSHNLPRVKTKYKFSRLASAPVSQGAIDLLRPTVQGPSVHLSDFQETFTYMRNHRSLPLSLTNSLCLLLVYALAVSLCAPFAPGRVEAATAGGRIRRKVLAPVAAKADEQKSRWRDGELLVRFSQEASSSDVESLLLANGAHRMGRLRGQSKVERLRLSGLGIKMWLTC